MSVLIKNVMVLDAQSAFYRQQVDILIQDNKIKKIGKDLNETAQQKISGKELFISPGWVDVLADYREPGYEHLETIESGLNAALSGGFKDVFIVPNTEPVISSKSLIEFILNKSKYHQVNLHVLAAVSNQLEGKSLAEMIDMKTSGAIAFTDGWKPIQDAGLLVKALEYVKSFNGTIVQIPIHADLSKGGFMNEGEVSFQIGMSAIPSMAESLMVHRDLELLKYADSKIHFSGVSTLASLDLIRKAKKEGLNVSCSVTPYHLLFSDEMLKDYDSIYKVSPPLRTERERKQLIKAVKDGTIDCIATHHKPQDWDGKTKEFEYAEEGMISQETCWSMLLKAAPEISMEQWVNLLSDNPREIFDLPKVVLEEGAEARFTVFDKESTWIYSTEHKQSKGINSPFLNKELKGKIYL